MADSGLGVEEQAGGRGEDSVEGRNPMVDAKRLRRTLRLRSGLAAGTRMGEDPTHAMKPHEWGTRIGGDSSQGRNPTIAAMKQRRSWGTRWGVVGLGVAVVCVMLAVWVRAHDPGPVNEMISPEPQSLAMHEMSSRQGQSSAMVAKTARLSENLTNVGTAGGGGAPSPVAAEAAPMIARTVSLTVQVKQVSAARTLLEALLARHHGYMAEMTANQAEGAPHVFTASLRIPAGELEAALKDLRTLGKVENESQTGEEVSQQHQDLAARLKTARETEERLQSILQQRTGSVADVLQVEEEIARVRGEIESMEAEQAGLEHRVDFASVDVTATEEAQFGGPEPVGARMREAFVAGYKNAGEMVVGMVVFAEEAGPSIGVWVVLLGVPGVWGWRRWRRMRVVAESHSCDKAA